MANLIQSIIAREILDSRGNPTIAVRVTLQNGLSAEAMVPSGASTGKHEALELRDHNAKRYNGKGVLQAVKNVHQSIAKKLIGKNVLQLQQLDDTMLQLDGTSNKAKLGANAILGVSLAAAQVGALATKQPFYRYLREVYHLAQTTWRLPYPMMNILNGGAHADNGLAFQEFMIVPQAKQFAERMRQGAEVFHALKSYLNKHKLSTGVGDEGGFAPAVKNTQQALTAISVAIKQAGYVLGKDMKLALDAASSEFYDAKRNRYQVDGKQFTGNKLNQAYASWAKRYHIISIEDGMAEDDWQNWQLHTAKLGETVQLVGDD